MNLKTGFYIFIIILLLFFSSCNKDNAQQDQTALLPDAQTASLLQSVKESEIHAQAPKESKAAAQTDSYAKILNGDLSEFAGVWVSNTGHKSHLRADGTFFDGSTAENFRRNDDNVYGTGAYYQWDILTIPDEDGFYISQFVILFPAGVDIKEGNRIFQSDTAKARICMGQHDFVPASQIIYREETAQVMDIQELRSSVYDAETHTSRGSPVSGNLSAGQWIWYSVTAEETGYITVEVTSDVDTYLEAYNEDMKIIAENDDWENWNPRIEFIGEAHTTYFFKLRGFNSSTNGPFRISASHKPLPEITRLESGAFKIVNIEIGVEHWFSVEVTEGDYLTVMTEGNIDTVLNAYTDSFEHAAYNDDIWYGDIVDRNASISIPIWDVKAGTVFLFKLTGFDSGPTRVLVTMGYAEG